MRLGEVDHTHAALARRHLSDESEDLILHALGSLEAAGGLARLERLLAHLHEAHGLVHVVALDRAGEAEARQSGGQAQNAEEDARGRERGVHAHARLLPHFDVDAHDVVGERAGHHGLLGLAEGDVAAHELHVKGREVGGRLHVVLMHVGDVLRQAQVRVSVGSVLDEPEQVEAREERRRQLNVLLD